MGCLKRKYFTKHEADRVLLNIKNNKVYKSKEKQESRSYLCTKCGSYHLTSINTRAWDKMQKVNEIKKWRNL